jgi:hypothetical protein
MIYYFFLWSITILSRMYPTKISYVFKTLVQPIKEIVFIILASSFQVLENFKFKVLPLVAIDHICRENETIQSSFLYDKLMINKIQKKSLPKQKNSEKEKLIINIRIFFRKK